MPLSLVPRTSSPKRFGNRFCVNPLGNFGLLFAAALRTAATSFAVTAYFVQLLGYSNETPAALIRAVLVVPVSVAAIAGVTLNATTTPSAVAPIQRLTMRPAANLPDGRSHGRVASRNARDATAGAFSIRTLVTGAP